MAGKHEAHTSASTVQWLTNLPARRWALCIYWDWALHRAREAPLFRI